MLAFVRDENNEARATRQRCKAFSLLSTPLRIKPN